MRPLAAAVLALGLAACGSDAPTGAAARDAAVAAWKAGSLQVSALTAATVPIGKDCQSGTVGAIDVVVCVFPTPAEAKAAEDAGLAWVGETTGAAQARGTLLIAAADRRKSDPSGRTINQLMKLAPK
jgi:hypothetical protein